MNKLGIFMNFWEKNWDADHAKYIKRQRKSVMIYWNFRHSLCLKCLMKKSVCLKRLPIRRELS